MWDSSVTGVCPGRRLSSCRGVAVALSGGDASREFSGGLPCWQAGCMARAVKQPVVLMKWYRVVSCLRPATPRPPYSFRPHHFPHPTATCFRPRVNPRPIRRQAPTGGPLAESLDLVPRSDSHGYYVLGGLNERHVQERRQPAARLDLSPGPVGVIWPRAGRGRHGTLGRPSFAVRGRGSYERPAT